jgi:16S rRNA (guanine527-N7)-methyltransferase
MSLKEQIEDFGLNSSCTDKLEKYKEILLDYNQKVNLTSITDSEEINIKHFLDSLSLFKTDYLNGSKSVIDIGSGAGFPGMVIKIYNEDLKVTLIDSLNKRIKFLDTLKEELNLENIENLHARAEELARNKDYREKFDIATSRAVANLSTLSEYCLPFVKVGGYFIAMKGPGYKEELDEARKALEILGASLKEIVEIKLPGDIDHYLLVIKKERSTGSKYPRGGGKPRSKPL